MPTYEYECTKCGAVVELFQSITEPPRRKLRKSDPRACDCGAPVARRIGTGGGIIFKGSGFYTTDYRGDGYAKAAKAESGSADTEPGGEKKPAGGPSDTKAAKAKPKSGPKSE